MPIARRQCWSARSAVTARIDALESKQADTDPMGPESGRLHVVRGSHWRTAGIAELRLAYRDGGEGRSQNVGLRVARYGE